MTHLTADNLEKCAALLADMPYTNVAALVGISEPTLYLWRTKSAKAREANDIASPFYLEKLGMFFDDACDRGRRAYLEARIRRRVNHGILSKARTMPPRQNTSI